MAGKERPVSPINGQPLPEGKPWRTSEEAREAGKKGGKRSAEVRRERKTLREELLALLTEDIRDEDGKAVNAQKAVSVSLVAEALGGNVRAFEVIRDTIGEKPAEKVDVQTTDYTALDAAYKAMQGE